MNITPQQFHYLCNTTTTEILTIMTEELGISLPEACDKLYHSRTFEKLNDQESGLYIQSPRYNLSYLMEELQ